jgi:hypothetical protein
MPVNNVNGADESGTKPKVIENVVVGGKKIAPMAKFVTKKTSMLNTSPRVSKMSVDNANDDVNGASS